MPGYAFSAGSLDQVQILSLILKFRTLTKGIGNKIISSKGVKVQSALTPREKTAAEENPWWLTGLEFTKSPAAVSQQGPLMQTLPQEEACTKLPASLVL